MSLRQMFAGSIVKPGFNPLAAQTTTTYYNLYAWGAGNGGKLGLGNTTYYSSPKQVGNLTNWLQVSGGYSSAAVKIDGTLWTWGQNNYGQLGLGDTTNRSSPTQVGALTNWSSISVATNGYVGVAIKTDGTLWTWGYNASGQLGLGNTTNYSSPKQVGSLTTWSKAHYGGYAVAAVKTDGTLWVWGQNSQGQLGLNNATAYSSPKQVGALTNWAVVRPSNNNMFAIKTDGTLWVWGNNNYGQLGLNNTNIYSSPKQVGALTNWSSTAQQFYATGAIKTNGTLWTWGYNAYGNLGLGNTTYYSSPKQIGALTNWSIIAGGGAGHFASIKTDGTIWTWGYNGMGQLGLGDTTVRSSPTQVGASTTWLTVACGYSHTLSPG